MPPVTGKLYLAASAVGTTGVGAIGSGMMPTLKSSVVVAGSVVRVVRTPSSRTLAAWASVANTAAQKVSASTRASSPRATRFL